MKNKRHIKVFKYLQIAVIPTIQGVQYLYGTLAFLKHQDSVGSQCCDCPREQTRSYCSVDQIPSAGFVFQ